MKVLKPKGINKCPDCEFTTISYNDFLEHRIQCLRKHKSIVIGKCCTDEECEVGNIFRYYEDGSYERCNPICQHPIKHPNRTKILEMINKAETPV